MMLQDGMTPLTVEQPDLPRLGDKPSIPITLRVIMDHVVPVANGYAEGNSLI